MSCREKAGGRLATSLARATTELNDIQVSSILHELIREYREVGTVEKLTKPTREMVTGWANNTVQEAVLRQPDMSENRRRKLENWATQIAVENLPDPALFHAWKRLQYQAQSYDANLKIVYDRLAEQLEEPPGVIRDRVQQLATEFYQQSTPATRRLIIPPHMREFYIKMMREEGYLKDGQNLPHDSSTLHALRMVQHDAQNYIRRYRHVKLAKVNLADLKVREFAEGKIPDGFTSFIYDPANRTLEAGYEEEGEGVQIFDVPKPLIEEFFRLENGRQINTFYQRELLDHFPAEIIDNPAESLTLFYRQAQAGNHNPTPHYQNTSPTEGAPAGTGRYNTPEGMNSSDDKADAQSINPMPNEQDAEEQWVEPPLGYDWDTDDWDDRELTRDDTN